MRVAMLERERHAWELERAAWLLAATARPVDFVLSLPSITAGLTGIARRAAAATLSALRRRLLV
jgi:hypothetical protein